jgi:hypothetical protein
MRDFLSSRFGRCWLLLVFIGSLLRLWQIGAPGLWYDEICTAWSGTLPFARMLAAVAGDVHPPLYYALVWAIEHIFHTDNAILLRLPSAMLGIAAFPLLLAIGRRLQLSDRAILIGTGFMAASTFQLYFSQEVRMYALFQAEILLAIVFMLDRHWFRLTFVAAAMLYTHNYGLIYCAVIYGLAFLREMGQPMPADDDELKKFKPVRIIASGLSAFVLYLPWLPVLSKQMTKLDSWWQTGTTPGSFLSPFHIFFFGDQMLGGLMMLSEAVVFGLLAIAVITAVRAKRWTLLALAFAPMLLSVAIEIVTGHPTFLYRSFIGSSGMVFLLCGDALDRVRKPMDSIALGALAPLMFIAVVVYYPYMAAFKTPVHFWNKVLLQPGDVIYHLNPGSLIDAYTYSRDAAWHTYIHPAMAGDRGALSDETLQALGATTVMLDDLEWQRAWLMWPAGPTTGADEDIEVARLVYKYHGQLVTRIKFMDSQSYKSELWLLQR